MTIPIRDAEAASEAATVAASTTNTPMAFSMPQAKTKDTRRARWPSADAYHHLGIGLMTPDQVHYGQADAVHAARQNTLDDAFQTNPQRFVNKAPEPPQKPTAVWINPPDQKLTIQA